MTTRKHDLRLPARTPAWVSREVGAAELCISPDTWDRWVANGTLPAAAPGFPEGSPRWQWDAVCRRLSGANKAEPADIMAAARRLGSHGKVAGRVCEAA